MPQPPRRPFDLASFLAPIVSAAHEVISDMAKAGVDAALEEAESRVEDVGRRIAGARNKVARPVRRVRLEARQVTAEAAHVVVEWRGKNAKKRREKEARVEAGAKVGMMSEFWRAVAFGAGAAASFKIAQAVLGATYSFLNGILLGVLMRWKGETRGSIKFDGHEMNFDFAPGAHRGVPPPPPMPAGVAPMPAPPCSAAATAGPSPWVFSPAWTNEDKLRLCVLLTSIIRNDIYLGRYSFTGRPNIQSIHEMIAASPEELEQYRPSIEVLAREYEAGGHAVAGASVA